MTYWIICSIRTNGKGKKMNKFRNVKIYFINTNKKIIHEILSRIFYEDSLECICFIEKISFTHKWTIFSGLSALLYGKSTSFLVPSYVLRFTFYYLPFHFPCPLQPQNIYNIFLRQLSMTIIYVASVLYFCLTTIIFPTTGVQKYFIWCLVIEHIISP